MVSSLNFKNVKFLKSVTEIRNVPKFQLPEYAFIGRSNVGKSSLINALTGTHKLAKISSMPGKTVCLNYFTVSDKLYLVDLPGYGYAKISKKLQASIGKLVGEYLLANGENKLIFLLIDSRHEIKNSDIAMLEDFEKLSKNIFLVLTKCDKKGSSDVDWESKYNELSNMFGNIAGVIYTSSKTKDGIKYLKNIIITHYDNIKHDHNKITEKEEKLL